jgi:tetratricopeptide (TPR) repeat protein
MRAEALSKRVMHLGAGAALLAGVLPQGALASRPVPQQQTKPQQNSSRIERAMEQSTRTQKVANPLNDLLEEARRDIDEQHFEEAIPLLQKILAEQPDFAYAHFQLAYVYTALQRPAEAQAEYQRTVTLDPKMAEAYLNLGILLLDQRKPADAVAPLTKAVELLPSQSRPRVLLGVAQERSGNKSAAVESFEGVIHLDPHDHDALLHLANLYLSLNRPADAEPRLRAALEQTPNDAPTLLSLAETVDAEKKPEAAAEAYRNYLAVQPNDAAAQSRLVHLFLDSEQYDAALAELDRLQNGHPPGLELLKLRADILVGQKKLDDAIAALRQALGLAARDAQLHGGLGRLYLEKRDFPNAEAELKSAIQLDGNNIAYWKDLSTTYYLAKNYAATLAIYDRLDKVDPPNAGRWFIRALCYDNLKQLQPAYDAYQRFLAMDQNKDPNQVWQAQQRSKVLQRELEQKH